MPAKVIDSRKHLAEKAAAAPKAAPKAKAKAPAKKKSGLFTKKKEE